MVTQAYTVAFEGVSARSVEVQCAVTPGLPAFSIVGLPDKAVSEARDRVRAALSSMSIALPSKRITINLSPADLTKSQTQFLWASCPSTAHSFPSSAHSPPP
jgi:magnesium chelatase family protein